LEIYLFLTRKTKAYKRSIRNYNNVDAAGPNAALNVLNLDSAFNGQNGTIDCIYDKWINLFKSVGDVWNSFPLDVRCSHSLACFQNSYMKWRKKQTLILLYLPLEIAWLLYCLLDFVYVIVLYTRNTCMQQPLAYILQTLFHREVFEITSAMNAGSRCSRHVSHGNTIIVFF
jgi:hypothetical protein